MPCDSALYAPRVQAVLLFQINVTLSVRPVSRTNLSLSPQSTFSGLPSLLYTVCFSLKHCILSIYFYWGIVALWLPSQLSWSRIHLQCRRPWFNSWVREIRWRRDRLPTPVFLDFLCGSAGEESARKAGDLGSILGLGRSPGEGKGYPLQYSGLENSMDYSPRGRKESETIE